MFGGYWNIAYGAGPTLTHVSLGQCWFSEVSTAGPPRTMLAQHYVKPALFPRVVLAYFWFNASSHKARFSRGRRPRPREQRAWLSGRWFNDGPANKSR